MNTGIWENLYQSLKKPPMDPVMTGFNANIDRIIRLTPALLRSLEQHAITGFDALLPRLEHSLKYCSADEIFIREPSRYRELSGNFSRSGTISLGGQAGIAAVHLRRLGVPSVTCVVPGAGPRTCALLGHAGVTPLTFAPGRGDDIVHLVFEYPPDLVPPAEGVVPRSNRFIVSPLHDPSTVLIPPASAHALQQQTASCRRAFLSGYQYLHTEQEFVTAARQIRMIRDLHPLMRTHVECVSGAERQVMELMLRHIFPNTDSIGLNERELGLFMQVVRASPAASADIPPCSPLACVRDAVTLAGACGVSRVHLHTFGYYVLVLKPETCEPEVSRNALLLAARVAAETGGPEEPVLSQEGLLAIAAVRETWGPEEATGIFRIDDHGVVIVPTYISPDVQKTTGLGDVISSTAFVADRF
jgi:ADP-dependent phosphofructokinase/glucokinase